MQLRAIGLVRVAGCACLLFGAAVWIGAGGLPWLSERWEAEALRNAADAVPPPRLAWVDAPARAHARRNLALGRLGQRATTRALLEHAARARPLYAPTWLALAELAHRSGDPEGGDRFARLAAALWPHRERLLWRIAGLRAEMGDREGTLGLFRSILRSRPERVESLLAVARRLEPDPILLVAELVPEKDRRTPAADDALTRMLGVAASWKAGALARALWQALSPARQGERTAATLYVDAQLAAGWIDEALPVWKRLGTGGLAEHGISNPGFEEHPAQRGLGWRIWAAPGTSWTRDGAIRHGGQYSLRVSFEGTEDVSYLHAAQVTVVKPARSYRLSGHWRGQDLTTPSGPFLEVVAHQSHAWLQAAGRPRVGSWDWEPFALAFRVPEGTRLVEIRLRREPSGDPNRGIAGQLWLDDLTLAPLADGGLGG